MSGRPPHALPASELLSVRQAAALLELHPARVYELINRGVFPAVRVSERAIRIPRADLEEWIESKRTKAGLRARQASTDAEAARELARRLVLVEQQLAEAGQAYRAAAEALALVRLKLERRTP